MKETMEIAMSFIVHGDEFFFEQRKEDRANGALGKIGCWGGQLEPKEEPITAVHREITKEEVRGLEGFTPDHFEQLSHKPLKVMSDRDGKTLGITAHVFRLLLPIGYKNRISAPNSIWLNPSQYLHALDNNLLTPATERASIDLMGMVKKDREDGIIDN